MDSTESYDPWLVKDIAEILRGIERTNTWGLR
jgi:hypothetical protein